MSQRWVDFHLHEIDGLPLRLSASLVYLDVAMGLGGWMTGEFGRRVSAPAGAFSGFRRLWTDGFPLPRSLALTGAL